MGISVVLLFAQYDLWYTVFMFTLGGVPVWVVDQSRPSYTLCFQLKAFRVHCRAGMNVFLGTHWLAESTVTRVSNSWCTLTSMNQWQCFTQYAVKMKARTEGEKGRYKWRRLVDKVATGKTSYNLTLKATADMLVKYQACFAWMLLLYTKYSINGGKSCFAVL